MIDFRLRVPADLPAQDWSIAIQADVLTSDEKQVVATTYSQILRLPAITAATLMHELPEKLTAKAGESLSLDAKISRHPTLRHPVRVTLEGLGMDIPAPTVVVPADSDTVRMVVAIPAEAKEQQLPAVRLVAVMLATDDQLASVRFQAKPFSLAIAAQTQDK